MSEPLGLAGVVSGVSHMNHDDKRRLRQLKRNIKKAGNKRRRQHFKRALTDHPEDAHLDEADFGRHSSASFNGMDQDATRRTERKD